MRPLSGIESAQARDPLNGIVDLYLNTFYMAAGNHSESERLGLRLVESHPEISAAYYNLGLNSMMQGEHEKAMAYMLKEPSKPFRDSGMPAVLYALGRKPEAEKALTTLIESYGSLAGLQIAQNYALMGEVDRGMDWLEQAFEKRDPGHSHHSR